MRLKPSQRAISGLAALATIAAAGHAAAAWEETDIRTRLALPAGTIEMVLDSDMYNEVDDQFALAYTIGAADRIRLRAVCAAPFLNRRSTSAAEGMEKSYQETLRLLKLIERKSEGLAFRGSERFLADRETAVDSPAAQRIIELALEERTGPLFVVGLGAATNIASALLLEPAIRERIVVVWIGGHPYSWDHARDFNLRQDIPAAQVLFDSGVPLVHIPAGDVAAALTVSIPELEAPLKGTSEIADLLLDNVETYYVETGGSKKRPRSGEGAWTKIIWDIATIAWLLAPEELAPSTLVPAPILTDAGTWKEAEGRHPVRVVVRLDRKAVFQDLFRKLSAIGETGRVGKKDNL